jgi:hypothetical protein
MNMQETTLPYSHIRLGDQRDNAAILDFYSSVAMDAGDIDLRYERTPDFFAFLNCQGERGFVIIFERDEPAQKGQRKIGGVATISVRPCLLEGKETKVAYLADLRLSPHLERGPRLQFRKWYETLVNTAKNNTDLGSSGLMYSAILDKNQIALSSLVRKNGDVHYSPIQRYQGVAVLGRWPWTRWLKRKSAADWQVMTVTDFTDPTLLRFLQMCNAKKSFGYVYPQELEFRQKKWPGFSQYPFLAVKNSAGKILACALPWRGSHSRKAVIEKMPARLKFAAHLLPFIQGKRIREQDELNSLYLTHLEFDPELTESQRGSALEMILNFIFARGIFSNQHVLHFIEPEAQPFLDHLSGYYRQSTPATAYQVASRSHTEIPLLNSLSALEIGTL